jgi:hypothetical protein
MDWRDFDSEQHLSCQYARGRADGNDQETGDISVTNILPATEQVVVSSVLPVLQQPVNESQRD